MSELNGWNQIYTPYTNGAQNYEYYTQAWSNGSVPLLVAITPSSDGWQAPAGFVPQPNVVYYTAPQAGAPQNPIVPTSVLIPQGPSRYQDPIPPATNVGVITPNTPGDGGAPVPEPGTWVMLASAMVLILLGRKLRTRCQFQSK